MNDIPEDLLDYTHVKATHRYEHTLSTALEKHAQAGIVNKKVPTAQDKFLDNAHVLRNLSHREEGVSYLGTSPSLPIVFISR